MSKTCKYNYRVILLLVVAQLILVAHSHPVFDDHESEHCAYCLAQDHSITNNTSAIIQVKSSGEALVENSLLHPFISYVIRIQPRAPPFLS